MLPVLYSLIEHWCAPELGDGAHQAALVAGWGVRGEGLACSLAIHFMNYCGLIARVACGNSDWRRVFLSS